MRCIFRHAFLHPLQLLRRRLTLIFRFPLGGRHAVDQGACFFLRQFRLRLHHPVGKAVAAEAGKAHQLDIFGIMAVLQMRHQPPECRCRCLIADLHSYAPFA